VHIERSIMTRQRQPPPAPPGMFATAHPTKGLAWVLAVPGARSCLAPPSWLRGGTVRLAYIALALSLNAISSAVQWITSAGALICRPNLIGMIGTATDWNSAGSAAHHFVLRCARDRGAGRRQNFFDYAQLRY
jgi:hypothetical protein